MNTNNDENDAKKRRLMDDNNKENVLSSKPTESLYLEEELADVHFIFESSTEQIPAHKHILAKSPVFDNTFKVKIEEDKFKIGDACADGFKEFLQFFYLKELILSMQHIESVMYLCRKYEIHQCLKTCSTFLMENLSIDKMFFGLKLAIDYNQNDLKEFCQQKIATNTDEVLKSDAFLNCNCDWNVLMEMVKSNVLSCRELVLLEACINWARNACKRDKLNDNKENIREKLKNVIYEIRFKEIPMIELAIYLKNSYNPYNSDELEDITRLIGQANINSAFNCSTRLNSSKTIPWNDTDKLICERWNESTPDYNVSNSIATVFSSNKSLLFGEFGVYLKPFSQSVYCEILVEKMDGPKIIDIFTRQMSITEGDATAIALPKRVFIEENIKYKIQLNFWCSDFQLKSFGKLKQQIKLVNGAVITFHEDASSGFNNIERNVIVWLNFNEINS